MKTKENGYGLSFQLTNGAIDDGIEIELMMMVVRLKFLATT